MTRRETAKLLAVMQATYPNLHFDDLELALDAWATILQPDDGQQIMDAFSVYARTDTSGFAPNPGKLHSMVESRLNPGLSEGEIVGMLTRAAKNGNYGYLDEYNRLPKLLRKAVGSPTVISMWGTMEHDRLQFVFSNIVKTYNKLLDEDRISMAAIGTNLERLENKQRLDALTDSIVGRVRHE